MSDIFSAHASLSQPHLHPSRIDPITGTELTKSSQDSYDARWAFKSMLVVGPGGTVGSDYTGDGVNDSAAIQAAINAAYLVGGGVVFIRRGLYLIGTTITPKSGVLIVGEGFATCLRANASMTAIFYSSPLTRVTNGGLRDICLDANNKLTVSNIQIPSFYGLSISNVWCLNANHVWSLNLGSWTTSEAASKSSHLTVRDLIVDGVTNTTLEPFILVNTDYFTLDNLTFRNCAVSLTASLSIYMNCRHGSIGDCTFIDTADQSVQLNLTGSDNISVLGNKFRWLGTNGATGISIYNCASLTISDNKMDNVQSGFGGSGIVVRDWNGTLDGHTNPYPNSFDLTITDNQIAGGYYGVLFTSDDIGSKNLAQSDVIISDNKIRDMTYCGILVGDATRITGDMTNFTIEGNNIKSRSAGDAHLMILQGNSTYKLKDFTVNGNRINGRGGNNASGIYADYLTNTTIQGNRITAKGNRSPIQSTNDDGLTISGNTLVPAGSTAPLVIAGSNASVYNNGGVNPIRSYSQGNATGTVTFDRINGDTIAALLTGNITVTLAAGKVIGDQLTLQLTQDATGSRTATWPTNFKKAGGSLILSTTANATDIVTMRFDGQNWIEVNRSLNVS